jgi:hypothetical protein
MLFPIPGLVIAYIVCLYQGNRLNSYLFSFLLRLCAPSWLKFLFPVVTPVIPALYDVFAVTIKEREAFQQPQKCGRTPLFLIAFVIPN